MIEFLQNYTTQAIPPEVFENEQRVERSAESEMYFVRLGLAAYVTEDGLVDADYRPIERKIVAVIEKVEPTAIVTGRAGELPVTVDAPVRASPGPGNAALFGSGPEAAVLADQVETLAEQADLTASGTDAPAKPARRTVTPAKPA